MDNFLEDFQEFDKKSFQGVWPLCSYDCNKRVVSQNQSKMKKLVNKIYYHVSFAFVSFGRMVAHIYRWSQCGWRVELWNMMKSFMELGSHKAIYAAFVFIGQVTIRISHISPIRM